MQIRGSCATLPERVAAAVVGSDALLWYSGVCIEGGLLLYR